AMMDAGVPLPTIIAGIAIGLVKEDNRHAVLTDIEGLEDHSEIWTSKLLGQKKESQRFKWI
ncbi:unnamed protein product, partial [marine sediment metagenome]